MYKIADEKFKILYSKYHDVNDSMTDYAYFLKSVKEDGTTLFNVPQEFQTNELIMTALETSNKPIHLMTRWSLEMCINRQREKLSYLNPIYRQPITDEEHESYLCNLMHIIYFKYDKYIYRNKASKENKLYTFVDFFSAVCKFYSGMDTICYVYLYRGTPIPIKIKFNEEKRNFKLIYNSLEKVLYLVKVSADEYKRLWDVLSQKLEGYYGKAMQMDEYYWEESPTETTNIPILQDGEYYETFKTIEEDGVVYDYTRKCILKVPNDLVDFSIPEGVGSIPQGCFMGNKSLKKVKFPSTIGYIPKATFMDCDSLEEVDLSLVETSDYSKMIVGSAAFCNCKSLKSIDMSKLQLEDEAEITFAYCLGIEDISKLKLSGTKKTQMNFFHCENLTRLVSVPYADYGHFDLAYCHSIREIRIPHRAIPDGMLCGCDRLESVKFVETSPWRKTFGDYCFAGCKSLVKIDTLKGGAQLREYSFADCDSLSIFVISQKDEWDTVISKTAFEGSPQVQLEWADDACYSQKEPIADYWKRKGIEMNEQKQQEKKMANKAKNLFIKVLSKYSSDKNAIGKLFSERGRFIGKQMLSILKYDICSWEEYMAIGRLFYECIPFSNMDDNGYIRTTLVSWAKSCSVQAYLKAPIHKKYDAIQQLYYILKFAHSAFENQKVIYGEKSRNYAKIDVLNSYFDYQVFEGKTTDEQKSFIKSYFSLSDIRKSYLIQYYLLIHLVNYNTIQNKKDWDFDYAKKEIEKLSTHAKKFGTITTKFLMDICRLTWIQFIKDDIEKNYEEMGENILYVEEKEAEYISFDFSKMEICQKTELIFESCRRFPDEHRCSNDNYDDENYNGYGRYRGSYVQDEMAWSDDDIDTILDGAPNAFWNID